MPIVYKDLVRENIHPLNLTEAETEAQARSHRPGRPPLFEVYMRMAEELAKRSTRSTSFCGHSDRRPDPPERGRYRV